MEHCSSAFENGLKATEKMSKDIEKKALLTIVMPVYNEVETVSKVIDRVINLDMDIELIVVDDGSTDGTREVLKKLEQDEVRIVFRVRKIREKERQFALAINTQRGSLSQYKMPTQNSIRTKSPLC